MHRVGDAVTITRKYYNSTWWLSTGFITVVGRSSYMIKTLDGAPIHRPHEVTARVVFTFAGMLVCT